MCYYYQHVYTCSHITYALGKYCTSGSLVQTPCKKRSIWQKITMGEECEDCAIPVGRGNPHAVAEGATKKKKKVVKR